MELRIREVAQQLFFEQGYAATSPTANPKSSAWSRKSSNRNYFKKEKSQISKILCQIKK
jgi:hypothetical protein